MNTKPLLYYYYLIIPNRDIYIRNHDFSQSSVFNTETVTIKIYRLKL